MEHVAEAIDDVEVREVERHLLPEGLRTTQDREEEAIRRGVGDQVTLDIDTIVGAESLVHDLVRGERGGGAEEGGHRAFTVRRHQHGAAARYAF